MPWYGNSFSYTAEAIALNAPNKSGVYVIGQTDATIYVGESNDLARRLLEHEKAQGTCINNATPTRCGFELVAANTRESRQDKLIAELKPICNQMLG